MATRTLTLHVVDENVDVKLQEEEPLTPAVPTIGRRGAAQTPVAKPIPEPPTPQAISMTYSVSGDADPEANSPFCSINPKINEWAWRNPTHFALTYAFVIASIQTDWPKLITGFPSFVLMLLNNFTKHPIPNNVQKTYAQIINGPDFAWNDEAHADDPAYEYAKAQSFAQIAPWASMLHNTQRFAAIAEFWNNRQKLFKEALEVKKRYDAVAAKPNVQKATKTGKIHAELAQAIGDVHNHFSKYKMLGTVKSAFLTQMTIGRAACMDSNNLVIYKDEIARNPKLSAVFDVKGGKELGVKNPGSKFDDKRIEFLRAYTEFCSAVSGVANESQFFWDNWVSLIALKINYSGQVAAPEVDGVEGNGPRPIWIGTVSKKTAKYEYRPAAVVYDFHRGAETGKAPSAKLDPLFSKYLEMSGVSHKSEVTPEIVSNQHLVPLVFGMAQLGLNPAKVKDVMQAMDINFNEARRMTPVMEAYVRVANKLR